MVKMGNWLPLYTQQTDVLNGRMLTETSLLGPAFGLSSFAEDDPKIFEKYFMETMYGEMQPETLNLIAKQIQPILNSYRVGYFL
jgi:hypothetical protein